MLRLIIILCQNLEHLTMYTFEVISKFATMHIVVEQINAT